MGTGDREGIKSSGKETNIELPAITREAGRAGRELEEIILILLLLFLTGEFGGETVLPLSSNTENAVIKRSYA